MNEEDVLNTPVEEEDGVTLIINVNPETGEVTGVEDLE